MINAKEELEKKLKEIGKTIKDIYWIQIYMEDWVEGSLRKKPLLDSDISQEIESNWGNLDFTYDNGFGGQELYGTVVFKDESWLERGEYDGSEWWNYKKLPEYKKGAYLDEI